MKAPLSKSNPSKSNTHSSQHFFSGKNSQSQFFSNLHESAKPFFSPALIQPKLKIGTPGDKYEQEADQMANRVVQRLSQAPSNGVQRKCTDCEKEQEGIQAKPLAHGISPIVQRQGSEAEQEEEQVQAKLAGDHLINRQEAKEQPESEEVQAKPENNAIQRQEEPQEEESPVQTKPNGQGGQTASPTLSSQLNATKVSGQALPIPIRTQMEGAFGADFSSVRIHTDDASIRMNQNLHAQAFTHGRDVYFNRGKFQPENTEGKRLLAHELTHVVQQGNNSKKISRQPSGNTHPLIWQFRKKSFPPEQIKLTQQYKYLIKIGANENEATKACKVMHKDISSKDVNKWWNKNITIKAYLFHIRRHSKPLNLLPPKLNLIWHLSKMSIEDWPATLIRTTHQYHYLVKILKANDLEAMGACHLMIEDSKSKKRIKNIRYYLRMGRLYISDTKRTINKRKHKSVKKQLKWAKSYDKENQKDKLENHKEYSVSQKRKQQFESLIVRGINQLMKIQERYMVNRFLPIESFSGQPNFFGKSDLRKAAEVYEQLADTAVKYRSLAFLFKSIKQTPKHKGVSLYAFIKKALRHNKPYLLKILKFKTIGPGLKLILDITVEAHSHAQGFTISKLLNKAVEGSGKILKFGLSRAFGGTSSFLGLFKSTYDVIVEVGKAHTRYYYLAYAAGYTYGMVALAKGKNTKRIEYNLPRERGAGKYSTDISYRAIYKKGWNQASKEVEYIYNKGPTGRFIALHDLFVLRKMNENHALATVWPIAFNRIKDKLDHYGKMNYQKYMKVRK